MVDQIWWWFFSVWFSWLCFCCWLLLLVRIQGFVVACFDGFGAITFCDSFATALVVLATTPARPVRPKLIN
jgi:hypothetical protein